MHDPDLVYQASNDRGKGTRIYTIHRLDNGHFLHTITEQGGKSCSIELPLELVDDAHVRVMRHLEAHPSPNAP